nr:MAG TPA: Metal binding domain of Ada [Caudoviricetes sp.]
MYYYLPQYIWTIIIAALLAFIMSGNAKKEAKEKMQDDSETLKVINHICATVTENDKNVTDDGIPVIPSSPSKNASSISKQSSYTKREKIISTVALILFGVCCILGYNIYSLQTNITAYQNKIQKYEKTLESRADYGLLKEKADFFDKHAVIVGEDKYYYHTYDCPSRPGYFWIYNTEAAVGYGYHPCPTCNPPKISN